MKRILSLLLALGLLCGTAFAEEFPEAEELTAAEEVFAIEEEEPIELLLEEEAVSTEELAPVEAVEETTETVEAEQEELPLSIEESQDAAASGTWGTCAWEISEGGALTIHTGTGANIGYDGSGEEPHSAAPWYPQMQEITAVYVTEPVVFPADCSYMFYNAGSCTSINLSGADTSHMTNMANMFAWCTSLKSILFTGIDTSNVTNMGGLFESCRALPSINLSGFDTSNVTYMGFMFERCASLTNLDLSNFNTAKVTNMYSMFEGCDRLRSVNLSSFDTSQVTTMTRMFADCYYLTSLNLSHFNTANVTGLGMSAVFSYCRSLTSLDVSHFDTSKVTSLSCMFRGCRNLKSLDLSSFRCPEAVVLDAMFDGCSSLTCLDLSGFHPAKLTTVSGLFQDCTSLTSVNLSGFDTSAVQYFSQMFSGCSSLTSLDLSSFQTTNALDIGSMFAGCEKITSLNLSSFITPNVKSMKGMFSGCRSLTSLNISGLDTSKVTDMWSFLYSCDRLTTFKVGDKFSFALVTLPDKSWHSKATGSYYTSDYIIRHRSNIADTYSTIELPEFKNPPQVMGLAGKPVDTNAARLTWDKVKTATSYQLWRSDNGGEYKWIKNCTTNVVNNYSLTPGMNYKYKVRAVTGNEFESAYGPFSEEISVHILGKIENFTVVGKDTNCAFLSWDRVEGCTGYQVFRTVAGSGEYTWVKNATTAQVANYSLTPNTTYYYKVRAYIDLPDGSRAYGQYSAGVKQYIQPQVKVSLQGGDQQITISWSKSPEVTGYQVFYTEAGTGGVYGWAKTIVGGPISTTLTGLKPDTDYWFKVRSYVQLPDGTRYYGQQSEAVHTKTLK